MLEFDGYKSRCTCSPEGMKVGMFVPKRLERSLKRWATEFGVTPLTFVTDLAWRAELPNATRKELERALNRSGTDSRHPRGSIEEPVYSWCPVHQKRLSVTYPWQGA
jgi:hypothetical protein